MEEKWELFRGGLNRDTLNMFGWRRSLHSFVGLRWVGAILVTSNYCHRRGGDKLNFKSISLPSCR